jgi:predicted phage terminase large subunit-like protein
MTLSSLESFLKLHDESVSRLQIRTNLIDWATEVMISAGLTPSAHHRFLLNNLDLVAKGKIKRLMILMPPGSAKSTYASVIFPIWWFIQHPLSSVIAASHTATLVEHFSRRIQKLVDEHRHKIGFGLQSRDRSASHWRTDAGGEYFAVGVRGAITGRRADLVILDDPVKSMAEADSAKHRQYLWDWYSAELITRLKPDARIVVIMTRWHDQDLGGQLITRGVEDWTTLRLPAIAESDDLIGRPLGAPLWPEWESLAALSDKQRVVGSRIWSALFQQSPHPSAGRLFDIGLIRLIDGIEIRHLSAQRVVRAWDLAATPVHNSNDPDWTVGLKLTQEQGGAYIVEDIVRLRGDHRAVQQAILAAAQADGHSVTVSIPTDPGQAGKGQAAQLASLLTGYRVFTSREEGSKLSRAMQAAAQISAGNLAVRSAPWHVSFIEELNSFPQGSKDDQVDALSRAFMTLSELPSGGRRLFVPFNIR